MFLVITPLREFWDTDDRRVFLGPWCLPLNEQLGDQPRQDVMPSPWGDRAGLREAHDYLGGCYERMLVRLGRHLSATHGIDAHPRYWRVLIGPWLVHYLHALYGRYINLRAALDRWPSARTVGLDPSAYRIPGTSRDFAMSARTDDVYNLQLFSQILGQMGHSLSLRRPGVASPSVAGHRTSRHAGLRVIARFGRKLVVTTVRAVRRADATAVLCDLEVPVTAPWTLAWRSGFRALPVTFVGGPAFLPPAALHDERRRSLATLAAADEFERIALGLLPESFPTLYLEGYEAARRASVEAWPTMPRVVVSAVGWHFNEAFKFFAAEASQHGARLVAVPHGVGYGTKGYSPYEAHEEAATDTSLVFGWGNGGKLKNVPSITMSTRRVAQLGGGWSRARDILFVSSFRDTYLYRFQSGLRVGVRRYIGWQLCFLGALSSGCRAKLMFRPYPGVEHPLRARIAREFPQIRWGGGSSLYEDFRQSRLVVVDQPESAAFEALVANIPTVLFWDLDRWEMSDDARPYFEELKTVGILCGLPEEAAEKVNAVYPDPARWWLDEGVQKALRAIVDRYALTSDGWAACWVNALEGEIEAAR